MEDPKCKDVGPAPVQRLLATYNRVDVIYH